MSRVGVALARRRIWAITRKELREYGRNRSLFVALALFPLIFLIQPLVVVFLIPSVSAQTLSQMHLLLYLLGLPALVPATLAAYAIAGERQQASLEPVLTTPIRGEELLLGKALAALIPSAAVAYAVYALFLAATAAFAQPGIAAALIQPQDVAAQVVFTPFVAALTIWFSLAISTRVGDVRIAQQVSIFASLAVVLVAALIGFGAVNLTAGQGALVAVGLVVIDLLGWRLVGPMFDRERLVAGTRS
jgi:ABC-type Na+ efflux pump permease subunit